MFDKRLLAMVPGAAKYILANVLFQWIALVCNIALFIAQETIARPPMARDARLYAPCNIPASGA